MKIIIKGDNNNKHIFQNLLEFVNKYIVHILFSNNNFQNSITFYSFGAEYHRMQRLINRSKLLDCSASSGWYELPPEVFPLNAPSCMVEFCRPNLFAAHIMMATMDTKRVMPIISEIAKTITPETPFLRGIQGTINKGNHW